MDQVTGYKWTCSKCGKVAHTSRNGGKRNAPAPLPEGWTHAVKFLYYETLCGECAKKGA